MDQDQGVGGGGGVGLILLTLEYIISIFQKLSGNYSNSCVLWLRAVFEGGKTTGGGEGWV